MENCHVIGKEFQFYKMKKLWRSVSQNVNTQCYSTVHLKVVKMVRRKICLKGFLFKLLSIILCI